jgi:hypothetical protein
MQVPRVFRRFSTAVRILREDGIGGILRTLGGKVFGYKKDGDLAVILAHETLRDRFVEIYERGYWCSRTNGESLSGDGSTQAFTKKYLSGLNDFLDIIETNIDGKIIFFDAPCGDFNWIGPITARKNIQYIGGDIVPAIIARNQSDFGSNNVSFVEFDITTSCFPAATIWHCRDCLFHFSFANINLSLNKFAASTIDYAILTCHYIPDEMQNRDISDGDFRYTDLRKAPFELPPPIMVIPDSSSASKIPRFTHVYTRAQIVEWLA